MKPKPDTWDSDLDGDWADQPGTLIHTHEEAEDDDTTDAAQRTRSRSAFRERISNYDGAYLSPATPMHPQPKDADDAEALKPSQPRSWTQAILFNSTAVFLVVAAGIVGYYVSPSAPESKHNTTPADEQADSLQFSVWGQVFGYICAVFYLASRVPQILLNYRRKSTEGLNVRETKSLVLHITNRPSGTLLPLRLRWQSHLRFQHSCLRAYVQ